MINSIDFEGKRTCDELPDCESAILWYAMGHTYLDRDSDWVPCEVLCINNNTNEPN